MNLKNNLPEPFVAYTIVPYKSLLRCNDSRLHDSLKCITDDIQLHPDYALLIPAMAHSYPRVRFRLKFTLTIHIGIKNPDSLQILLDCFEGTGKLLYKMTEKDWIRVFSSNRTLQDTTREQSIARGKHMWSLFRWIYLNKADEAGYPIFQQLRRGQPKPESCDSRRGSIYQRARDWYMGLDYTHLVSVSSGKRKA